MTITTRQRNLLITSASLIGLDINYVGHHDAYPSNYVSGIVVGIKTIDYNNKEVQLNIIDRDGDERSVEVCQIIVNTLLDNGKYVSSEQWSKSSTYINVKEAE